MKNYRTIFAAVSMAIISMPASAAPVTTKGGYEYDKNMLSNPAALNWNIEQCSHNGIAQNAQEKLAKLMNVEPSDVRHEYCRRILTAYAKGAIPYDDYVQFAQSHVMSASIVKALRIAGSRPAKSQNQHDKLFGFH
ncbi:hypothetical protein [Rhizobium rhizogenes]|jgi:hypothetical protein|uniref:hypothetical protein n=1 Tax=Rhizobium rhizogenes TaxID=359 RepID=UPI0015726F0F|nr:hypothetical protein [Rhizobium rhizogenes]